MSAHLQKKQAPRPQHGFRSHLDFGEGNKTVSPYLHSLLRLESSQQPLWEAISLMGCNWEEPSLPDMIFPPTDTKGVGDNKITSLHPLQKGTASAVHWQVDKKVTPPPEKDTRECPPIQQAREWNPAHQIQLVAVDHQKKLA